jgi:hypothetical protein
MWNLGRIGRNLVKFSVREALCFFWDGGLNETTSGESIRNPTLDCSPALKDSDNGFCDKSIG